MNSVCTAFEDLAVGDHICCMYDTEEERRAAVRPFVLQGIDQNYKLFYLGDGQRSQQVLQILEDEDEDMSPHEAVQAGRLQIVPAQEICVREDSFDPEAMTAFLQEESREALVEGFQGLCVTIEMDWLSRDDTDACRLVEYEHMLDQPLSGNRTIVLCQYNRRLFSAKDLVETLSAYPLVVVDGQYCENFYYIPRRDKQGEDVSRAELENRITNLAENKRAEEGKRRSEKKFREIFNNSGDAMYYHEVDDDGMPGRFLEVNAKACEMLGYSRKELLQMTPQDLDTREKREKLPGIMSQLLTKQHVTFETAHKAKDGSTVPVEISAHLSRTDERRRVLSIARDITERKRIYEEEKRMTAELDDLYENAPCGYHSLDADGVFVRINNTELTWLGYSRDELIGKKKFVDVITEESRETFAESFPGFKQRGWAKDLEFEMIRKDGSLMPVLLNATAVKDAAGNYVMSRSSVLDITARKQAEEERHRVKNLLRVGRDVNRAVLEAQEPQEILQRSCELLAETSGYERVWSITFDQDGAVQYTGQVGVEEGRFRNLLSEMASGWRPECVRRALDEPGSPFFVDATCDCDKCPLEECGKGSIALKCGFSEKNGMRGVLSIRFTGEYAVNGEEQNVIAAVANDIAHGLDRLEMDRKFRKSEERYRRLFETAQDGMLILQAATGKIMDANPYIEKILGFSRNELVGRELWQIGTFRHIAENKERFRELVETGYIRYEDLPMSTKDGGEASVEFVSNTYDAGGEKVVQCNIRDVTDRRQAERGRRQALEELQSTKQQVSEQERHRALTTMARGIAHDFNNALSPIQGFTAMLLDKPERLENREKTMEYLGHINKAANGAAETIRRMRKFYRPQEEAAFTEIDLNRIITDAVAITQPRWKEEAAAEGKHIDIETQFEDIPNVSGNEAELNDVMTNLIFNAVDAMPEGGCITVTTRVEEEHIVLEFSDNGVGMAEETRQKCLDPFYTEKGAGGSGLGLATVEGIVHRHNGGVTVKSTEGEGTTFRITLPAIGREEVTPEQKPGQGAALLRILVVEDEEAQQEMLREMLETDEHEVDVAANGAEALEKLDADKFDLVITDRAMETMGGDELAQKVKDKSPDMPVIMLTGFGDMMDVAGEKPSHLDALLGKPIAEEKLRQKIGEVTAR